MKNPILFALDVPDDGSVDYFCSLLHSHVGGFKIGLQLWNTYGPDIADWVCTTAPDSFVLLDLKLHDIPATISRATKAVDHLPINGLTVHVGDDAAGVQAAALAAGPSLRIFAITVLTSAGVNPCLCQSRSIQELVETRFTASQEAGAVGAVCSGFEVGILRKLDPDAILIVPGVRSDTGNHNDHKRIVTPRSAINDGADWIVVGREIRDAADPAVAAQKILESIQ